MSERLFNPLHVTEDSVNTLGQVQTDHLGQEYMYVEADSAIAVNVFVAIEADYGAAPITNTRWSGLELGGVAVVAIASGSFGWVMRRGQHLLNVSASAAAGTALRTTATAGQLDDATGGTTETVHGVVLTAARGGSAGTANARIENPRSFA